MKIGIISDTHDCIEATKKVIQEISEKGCKILIHCGDFCAPFIIKELAKFDGEVHCCFGNTDDRFLSTKLAIKEGVNLHGDVGEIEIDNRKIVFVHLPQIAENFALAKKYDLVLHGHTHVSRKEKINDTLLVNPGDIMGYKDNPSYAIYDTDTNEVEIIELK
ncbi:metallophosphoesterase [Candidatus Pacearchaeota archaeon]|nr:metallophosphoesterase [Candidatus Pacearchaeota archaeon]